MIEYIIMGNILEMLKFFWKKTICISRIPKMKNNIFSVSGKQNVHDDENSKIIQHRVAALMEIK